MQANPRVIIIGLGEIGYHNAEYITNQTGLEVDGYDINPKVIQRAINDKVIKKEAKTFHEYDHYLICVSTHNPNDIFYPSLTSLLDVAQRIAKEGKPGALVAIESTIPKGISRKICAILQHKLHVAHIPHRYFGDQKKEHGVKQLRVLGGCKTCCTNAALQFYKNTLQIPIYTLSSVELAELTKLIENSHRFLEIAFAQELKMFCDYENLDFEELRNAVNTKWNENILEARKGIGGHCLPKDTRMYHKLSQNVLPFSTIAAAITSNELYEHHIGSKTDLVVTMPNQTIPPKTRES